MGVLWNCGCFWWHCWLEIHGLKLFLWGTCWFHLCIQLCSCWKTKWRRCPLGWEIELCGSCSCLGGLRSLLNTEGILTLPIFLLSDGSLIWMWSASFAWCTAVVGWAFPVAWLPCHPWLHRSNIWHNITENTW